MSHAIATMFDGFADLTVDIGDTTLAARKGGSGPGVVLLHGFPETHLMWRDVAPGLANDFTVVCPDLPGYGASGAPLTKPDHAPHAKAAMAADIVVLMEHLGFQRFSVVGRDRGGRVAYRMALDHPECVERPLSST